MKQFLESTPTIDWASPNVNELARRLGRGKSHLSVVRACFEWVRDEIPHSADHNLDPVTCSASEVVTAGTGFCYAKSHLLAALLRANSIPAGLVYQRLRVDERQFCLHGLNAVWLPDFGWYRLDARGTLSGLVSECSPPDERLPFACGEPGERLFPGAWAKPVAPVVDALRIHRRTIDLLAHLPDADELGVPDLASLDSLTTG
jgi:hypothetical protein